MRPVFAATFALVLALGPALPAAAQADDWSTALTDPLWLPLVMAQENGGLAQWAGTLFAPGPLAALTARADPEQLNRWVTLAMAPEMTSALAKADPALLGQVTAGLTRPGLVDTLVAAATPETLALVADTLSDPALIEAVVSQSDPATLSKWLDMAFDPALIEAVLAKADPATLDRFVAAMMDPRVINAVTQAMTPELMAQMTQAMARLQGGQ